MAARQTFNYVKWLKTVFSTGALVIFLSGQSSAEAPAINVAVETGQSQILTVGTDIRKAAISNREIADIETITPRQLLIIGKNPGSTNLIIWDAAGQHTFFNLDVAAHQHQQVVLQVKVAEVGRSALRDLGINFSALGKDWGGASFSGGNFAAPRTVGATSGSAIGDVVSPGLTLGSEVTAALVQYPSNINVMIKALDKKGLFKTLAEPNLVVKSGEKGKFIAGQKIPFSMSAVGATGGSTSDIRFEEVGVKLDFAPTVLRDGYINLKIDPVEVSTIDPSTPTVLSQGQFPIINKRSTSTVVDLKEGESLVLAGLISSDASRAISKFPLLGDIPIIGALFRSKNFQNRETELIVIITPFLKKPLGKGEEPDLKAMTTITPGEENKMRWIPLLPDMSEDVVKEEK
ncbi:MAG: pilus assembly protein N-terminal domain-containing protein [Nitrospirae bacterium]|nr:pilus assembly protein N-terminal domain-containing protein [Nitrospirota bacterium]